MGFEDGDLRILYIKEGSDFVPIGCLTTNSFTETVELLPTTTRESNGWKTYVPTTQDATIPFEGIQPSDSTGVLSHHDLKLKKRARELVEWRIGDDTNTYVDTGFGYIIDIGEVAPAGDLITFSGIIQNYGVPSLLIALGDLFQSGATFLLQNGQGLTFN